MGGRGGGGLSQISLDDSVLLLSAQLRIAVSPLFNPESLEPSTGLQYLFIEWISVFQMKRNGDVDRVRVVEIRWRKVMYWSLTWERYQISHLQAFRRTLWSSRLAVHFFCRHSLSNWGTSFLYLLCESFCFILRMGVELCKSRWIQLINMLLRIYVSIYLRHIGLWSFFLMMSLSGLGMKVILVS